MRPVSFFEVKDSLDVKVSGAWKKVTTIHVNVSGTWKEITLGKVKVSGSWKQWWPKIYPRMIAFFTSDPGSEWQICNGDNGSLDLDGLYPMGADSEGSATGTNTHQHDSKTMNTGAANVYWGSGTITNTALRQTHVHSSNHQHASIDHQPKYHELIPGVLTGDGTLPAGTILFWDGTSADIPSGWTYYSHASTWLKCNVSTAGGERSSTSHTHTITYNTGNAGPVSMQSGYALLGSQWAGDQTHNHTGGHTHTAYVDDPLSITMVPMSCDDPVNFDDLPSGVISFFEGDDIPTGWSVYEDAYDRLIKFSTSTGTLSGEATHVHSNQTFNTGNTTTTRLKTNNGSSCAADTHGHSNSHDHPDAQTMMPARIGLLICVKD